MSTAIYRGGFPTATPDCQHRNLEMEAPKSSLRDSALRKLENHFICEMEDTLSTNEIRIYQIRGFHRASGQPSAPFLGNGLFYPLWPLTSNLPCSSLDQQQLQACLTKVLNPAPQKTGNSRGCLCRSEMALQHTSYQLATMRWSRKTDKFLMVHPVRKYGIFYRLLLGQVENRSKRAPKEGHRSGILCILLLPINVLRLKTTLTFTRT